MKNLFKKFFKFLGLKGNIILIISFLVCIVAVQNLSQALSISFLVWNIAAVSVLELIFISVLAGVIIGYLLGFKKNKSEEMINSKKENL